MFKLRTETSVLSRCAAISLTLASAQLQAQEKKEQLEEVVVTGSFIAGTPTDTAMPVKVITLEDMRNIGNPTNIDLVKNMTEVGQVAGETNRYNNFPIGGATVNLRNIGSRFTLVLFNGRRFPEQFSVAVGRFNNIAWIPNAPIGRVEVLKEGGAVTYGADAVGGVVNYITRKNYDGLEVKADYRYIPDSNGDYTADLLWGKKFGDSDFLVSAGYQHRSILRSIDRDWARQDYLINPDATAWGAGGSPGSYLFQTRSTTGTFTSINSAGTGINQYVGNRQMSAGGTVRDPNCSALGGFAGWNTTPTPICYFQTAQFEKLVEKSDAYNVYAEFNHRFAGSVKYHAEALAYYQNLPDITAHPSDGPLVYPITATGATQNSTPPGATGLYFVPGTNPAVADFLGSFLNSNGSTAYNAAQIGNITAAGGRAALSGASWRLFGNGGNPITGAYDIQHNSTKFYRFTHQLTGDFPDFGSNKFKWDVAVTYDHVADRKEINDVLVDRLQAALNGLGGANCTGTTPGANGCLYLNPFSSAISSNFYSGAINPGFVGSGTFTGYTPGQGLQNNADLIRWMYVPIWLERTYEDATFDGIISGETGIDLPGGALALAFGGQFRYRREDTKLDELSTRGLNPCASIGVTNCTTQLGPLAFLRQQTVLGAPADLLASNGTTRRRYPAAAVFIESELPLLDTVHAQVAGRFEKFYSDLTDRDNQVFTPAASIKWQALSWMALRASGGKTFSQVNPPPDAPPALTPTTVSPTFGTLAYNAANYNNVDVKPMKGKYFDVGFIVQVGGFQATLDYYDIRIGDYTRTMTATNVFAGLVMPGQVPANTNLINCSSPLLQPQAAFGGMPFAVMNGPCVQGSSILSSSGAGGIGGLNGNGSRINFFGAVDQTNSGQQRSSGIDISTSFTIDNFLGGRVTPSVDFTYVLKWELGDFVVLGVPVSSGYDGRGFRNTTAGRVPQAVPEWRSTVGLNYHRGAHNLNIAVRFIPSIVDDNAALYVANAARNANVGDASGVVTTGGTCTPSATTSDQGSVPAGAGTGQYGTGNVGAAGSVGFCSNQNVAPLAGDTVKSNATVDLTYRVSLPSETDLSLTVYNLFDEDPSFARTTINYDAGFGTPLGRNFKLQVAKRF